MPSRLLRIALHLLAGCAVLALAADARTAGAQAAPSLANVAAAAAPVSAQGKPGAGGPSQGVQVSGWWKIDVKNPDGKLVQHVEFENSVTANGANALAQMISGQASVGSLTIIAYVASPNGYLPCNLNCFIYKSGTGDYMSGGTLAYCLSRNCSSNLQTSVNNAGITLSGSITASGSTGTGVIDTVGTSLSLCDANTTTAACQVRQAISGFTAATLPSPLSVSAGQIVQFTVVLSFS